MPAMLPPVPRARRKRQKKTSTFPVPAAGASSKIPTFSPVGPFALASPLDWQVN